MPYTYETNGAAIYEQSFRMIRAESDLARFDKDEEIVAVRMIHAAGMVGLSEFIEFSAGFAQVARAAVEVAHQFYAMRGWCRRYHARDFTADNDIICTFIHRACGRWPRDGQYAIRRH